MIGFKSPAHQGHRFATLFGRRAYEKGNSAHQPREGFMAPTFRIFVRTAEGAEFQAFTWCRDEASGIARAWREGVEFGHDVAAVWAEAV